MVGLMGNAGLLGARAAQQEESSLLGDLGRGSLSTLGAIGNINVVAEGWRRSGGDAIRPHGLTGGAVMPKPSHVYRALGSSGVGEDCETLVKEQGRSDG
tara:strand:+ start:22711 stop:23007 length:297 start_codon:yes stop_codon:yes gene_type:complete